MLAPRVLLELVSLILSDCLSNVKVVSGVIWCEWVDLPRRKRLVGAPSVEL